MLKYLAICICFFVSGSLPKAVPFIDPCKPEDSACIMTSAKKVFTNIIHGNKDFGLETFDPLAIKNLRVGAGDLKLDLNDVVVIGLEKCTLLNFARDTAASTLDFEIECPIDVTGKYVASGKLLVLDVEGDGPFHIKSDKFKFGLKTLLKVVNSHGIDHYKATSFTFTYEPVEKVALVFENLFNGDKARAEPVEKILQENWKELVLADTIGRPIVEGFLSEIVRSLNKLFEHTPKNEFEIV